MTHDQEHGYTFVVASDKPHKVQVIRESLPDINVVHFDGTGKRTWSNMWNDCIQEVPTELVVYCQDKATPTMDHVVKGLALVEEGFGSVQMYCMGFVVFHKHLLDRIGWMDERMAGAGAHCDFLIRHKEADIAYYESNEVPYEQSHTTWRTTTKFLHKKWVTPGGPRGKRINYEQRLLPDQEMPYVTEASPKEFLPYADSRILTGNTKLYNRRFVR
jgi:hypothetical protein